MADAAFVFPGQGSQSVGMLKAVAEQFAIVTETFAEGSETLGYDLWDLVQSGPEEQLNQTEFTQPALLSASVALWRIARANSAVQPAVVAGHSLGEYSALVAAEVLPFSEAVRLVQQRGRFMQSAVPLGEGGMAAVLGLEDDEVIRICDAVSASAGRVQAANFNAPGQVVIAGSNAAIEAAITALKAAGAKRAMPLSVSAPFHSEAMKPAAEQMATLLSEVTFAAPRIPLIQNVDAAYHDDPDTIRANLESQMYSAVLWTDTVVRMAADGVTTLVECGPGKVLAGLTKRVDKSLSAVSFNSLESLAALEEIT